VLAKKMGDGRNEEGAGCVRRVFESQSDASTARTPKLQGRVVIGRCRKMHQGCVKCGAGAADRRERDRVERGRDEQEPAIVGVVLLGEQVEEQER
jgi:hypothetical protein